MASHKLDEWLARLSDQPVWQAVLDSLPDLVVMIDASYTIHYKNQAFQVRFGDQPDDFLSSIFYRALHSFPDPTPAHPFEQILTADLPKTAEFFESRLKAHFIFSVNPLLDANNQLAGALVVLRDISQQKSIEAAFKESQERYQCLVDLSPDAVVVHSEGQVVFANPAALRLFGAQSLDQITYLPIGKIAHHLDPDAFILGVEVLASGKQTQLFETHITRLDGEEIDVEMIAAPLTFYDKPAFQVVARDVTARKRAEQALRLSEENFRTIFNVNPFPTVIISRNDGRILLANKAAYDNFNYHGAPAEVSVFSFLAHPEDRSRLFEIFQQEGGISHFPLEIRMPTAGFRWVLANVMPLRYQGQDCVVIGIADITAQQNAETRLAKTNLQLEDALDRSNSMAMLAELQAKEAETLRQAGTIVAATLNQQEAIERILDQLHHVVTYDSACVQLRQGDHSVVMGGRGYPYPSLVIGRTFPINPQTPDWPAYQNHQPVILADTRSNSAYFTEDDFSHIQSWMAVPLILRERAIGLLVLDSVEMGHFTEHSAEMAAAFADQVAIALENARLYEQALHAADRRQVLYQTTLEINASHDLEHVYQAVHRATSQLMPCDAFVIAILDDNGSMYEDTYIIDQGARIPNQRLPVGEGMMGKLINRGDTMRVDDWDTSADTSTGAITLGEGSGTRSVLGVPLKRHARIIGAMSVQSYQPFAYHLEDQELLEQLAAQAATTIENVRLFEETQRLAITDDLTGLFNHRYLIAEAEREYERSLRYTHPLSLVIIDADLLKLVNDTHGHLAGNRVIQALGDAMQTIVRNHDTLGRFAGDEFLLILPETSQTQASQLAERLRRKVASLSVSLPDGVVKVTISLGVATLNPEQPETLEQLIHRADDSMYVAKRAGRNRVAS